LGNGPVTSVAVSVGSSQTASNQYANTTTAWESSDRQHSNHQSSSSTPPFSPGAYNNHAPPSNPSDQYANGLGPLGQFALWNSDEQGAGNLPSTQSTGGISGSDEDVVTEQLPQHGGGSTNHQSVTDSDVNWANMQRDKEIVQTNPIFSKPMGALAAARHIVTTLGTCNANSERMLKYFHASDVKTYSKLNKTRVNVSFTVNFRRTFVSNCGHGADHHAHQKAPISRRRR
jgi:hypothetical protein